MGTASESGDSNRNDQEFQTGPVLGPTRVIDDDQAEPSRQRLPPGPVPPDTNVTVIPDDEDDVGVQRCVPSEPITTMTSLDRKLLEVALVVLVILAIGFGVLHAAADFARLQSQSPIIAWFYLASLGIVSFCLLIVAARSWRRYRLLRDVTKIRELVGQYEQGRAKRPGDDHRLRKEWNKYFSVLEAGGDSQIKEAINRVRAQFNDYSNDGERDLGEVELYLLTPLDQRADEIIETRAAQTAVATALASHSFDILIVSWQSVKLVSQISQLYAGRPGLWGTLRLLRRGMAMVVFAEIADLAAQALTGAVAQKSLAMLGGRVAEGTANGLLMLRLGDAIQQQCRPAPSRRTKINPVRRLGEALINRGMTTPNATDSSYGRD